MARINYLGMNTGQLVRAVARLAFSPMCVAGKSRMVFQHGAFGRAPAATPRNTLQPNLIRALNLRMQPQAGDNAVVANMRGFLRRVYLGWQGRLQVGGVRMKGMGTRGFLFTNYWLSGRDYVKLNLS